MIDHSKMIGTQRANILIIGMGEKNKWSTVHEMWLY